MWKITKIKIKPTLFLYSLGWRRETLFQQPSDFNEFNTRSCIQPSVYNYGTKIQSYNGDGLFKNKYCTDSRRIWTKNNKLQLVIWKFKLTLVFLIRKINTKLLQNTGFLWLSLLHAASESRGRQGRSGWRNAAVFFINQNLKHVIRDTFYLRSFD